MDDVINSSSEITALAVNECSHNPIELNNLRKKKINTITINYT